MSPGRVVRASDHRPDGSRLRDDAGQRRFGIAVERVPLVRHPPGNGCVRVSQERGLVRGVDLQPALEQEPLSLLV